MSKRHRPEGTTKDGVNVYTHDPYTGEVLTNGAWYERGASDKIAYAESDEEATPLVPPPLPHPDDALRMFRDQPYMDGLSNRQREVLILATACMMSDHEIADYLGISPLNARVTRSHALRRCRRNA